MEISRQSNDPRLARFESWLATPEVNPPRDLLDRIRTRLREAPELSDEVIDELLLPDPSLRNEFMVAKVRHQLQQEDREAAERLNWSRWLTPLAAAATLTFALISFQSRVPSHLQQDALAQSEPGETFQEPLVDAQLTQIIALAANLQSNTDVTKLESVEDLAFLFD